jgi:hypothetical protein
MPARRKIPLVWKSAKQSDQTLLKYSPASGRTVQVGCGCTTATPPGPTCESFYPTYGYLIYEEHLDVYPLGPVYFWCTSAGVTEDPPVPAPDYNGTTATRCNQLFTVLGEVNPPIPTEVFYRYYFGGSGQFKYASIIYVDPISLKISTTDTYNVDQTAFLQQMAAATTITLTSVITPTITWDLTINSTTSDLNYWTYYYTLSTFTGVLTNNEMIKITYA